MTHEPFLLTLVERLAGAVGAGELDDATRPPGGAGVARSMATGDLRVGPRLLRSASPRVTLALDPPAGARELCAAWGVARPVAVSPDVHQATWNILVAGDELPDAYATRIAAHPITAGRWEIAPRLSGRPAGDLPGVVSGASPAYDVVERGGAVSSIEIAPRTFTTSALDPDHPDVRALLAAMEAAHPAWRGSGAGWRVDPAATFVLLADANGSAAGGALTDAGGGVALASQLAIVRGGAVAGAALLDALEAVAWDRGAERLRLDSSAFLQRGLPHARCGYTVGPDYAGDADVDVWTEKVVRGVAPAERRERRGAPWRRRGSRRRD